MKYRPDVNKMARGERPPQPNEGVPPPWPEVFIFWKLYVLPWGQMSLWGATVITNLLSAIPWIGKDLVEFEPFAPLGEAWGGQRRGAATPPPELENGFIYSNIVELSLLPVIGTVNSKAANKIKLRIEEEKLEALKVSKPDGVGLDPGGYSPPNWG